MVVEDSTKVVTIKLFQGVKGLLRAIGQIETPIALGVWRYHILRQPVKKL